MLPLARLVNASGSLLSRLGSEALLCRGCLEPLSGAAEAGLCGRCWEGLLPLPENRCPVCALPHGTDRGCPEPTAWSFGDALWDYHGGRPPLGSLLLPGIKGGERGWKRTLLRRVERFPLPAFARDVDLITAAPTSFHRRWIRGFDLAEEAARLTARKLDLPFQRTLARTWTRLPQTGRTETERRRLPRKAIRVRSGAPVSGRCILLMDDVWTTGTTLLRCAQALEAAGAREIRVLTLFRAL
jgi:predicted amidophosphoribosyltransferase